MKDINCLQQILGGLIKKPSFLSETDKYSLNLADFSRGFERTLFVAIAGLYSNGAKMIGIVDIENYLESDEQSKRIFKDNNGIEYLQDIIEYADPENFEYYYTKLKKLNLIRDFKKLGIDTSAFYCEDLANPKAFEINKNFENLTIKDIVEQVKKKIYGLEKDYMRNDVTETETAFSGMEELIENFSELQGVGVSMQGEIFNEIVSGARKKALYIRSGSSGLGKTRQSVGDACFLAFPIRYDPFKEEWVNEGSDEKVLFIATEQDFDEIRKIILAYLTGINEDKFKYADFSDKEKKILKQALRVMEVYEQNFHIVRMPNPTIELVRSIVRENCLLRQIEYVFYDYIFIGPSLLNEFKGFNLRNDEALFMFATALKDLAVELDIFVMTSTQVNANSDDNKNIRNESSLAGGRATINKADIGVILARPTKEELDTLSKIVEKHGIPNMVADMFKIRGGAWSQVRIWSTVDLGTMRKKDLFVTNSRLEPIQGFFVHSTFSVRSGGTEKEKKIEEMLKSLETET